MEDRNFSLMRDSLGKKKPWKERNWMQVWCRKQLTLVWRFGVKGAKTCIKGMRLEN